jgi:hypothetical protein
MRKNIVVLFFALIALVGFSVTATAQRKAKLGKVCGDPKAACKGRENFQTWDLPFDTGKNFVIANSEWFYGIVLKSKKMKPEWGDCEHPMFAEKERSEIQDMFQHNKVFTLNCVESGSNYYTGVADHIAFIGVYAGRTLAQANAFLKTVQATKKFSGIRVRRMQADINGT